MQKYFDTITSYYATIITQPVCIIKKYKFLSAMNRTTINRDKISYLKKSTVTLKENSQPIVENIKIGILDHDL
jgi:hypothetical protein